MYTLCGVHGYIVTAPRSLPVCVLFMSVGCSDVYHLWVTGWDDIHSDQYLKPLNDVIGGCLLDS